MGRAYAAAFRRERTDASRKIQSIWRMYVDRKRAREYFLILSRVALLMQRCVRGWRARKFVEWKRRNDWAAVRIEAAVRGMLAKNWYRKALVRKFHDTVVVPAAIKIQAVIRGMYDRRLASLIRAHNHLVLVKI